MIERHDSQPPRSGMDGSARIGRFVVDEEIGRAPGSVVYRGMHPGLRLAVAIKVFTGSVGRDPGFIARFRRETSAIASLSHPGIARVFDVDDQSGSLAVVTEYFEALTLRALIASSRRLEPDFAVGLMRQVLDAVGAVHALGIVHGHLKPENILVSTEGHVRVTDFGMSQMLSDGAFSTGAARLVHTGAYLAPEQVLGQEPTPASDMYALGAILFELLDGQPPFTGTMPSVLHAHLHEQPRASAYIPGPVAQVIRRALQKESQDRFASCGDFARALASHEPESDAPHSHATRLPFRIPLFGGS